MMLWGIGERHHNEIAITSCRLDPIPTWLLKKCVNELVPVITQIINLSFKNGDFPDTLKSALITPLIKKPSLDCEVLKNYRPVANLKFLAKTIERAFSVLHRYNPTSLSIVFVVMYNRPTGLDIALKPPFYAYTTTCFSLWIKEKRPCRAGSVRYSAAFDTINHNMFLTTPKSIWHLWTGVQMVLFLF